MLFSTRIITFFVFQFQTAADMKIVMDEKVKNAGRSKIQPYIMAVGSENSEKHNHFFVILDNHKYKVATAIEAVDMCFKLFHVFSACYPPASEHIWRLIERGVYKFQSSGQPIPRMQKIFKQLMAQN